jgi:hypothetical protein
MSETTETQGDEPRRLTIGERGPDGRVYLGYAIINRKIIHTSVSSIKQFDPTGDTGCPRRWFYRFREGKKEEKSKAQTGGSEYDKQMESYLKTGTDNLQPVLLPVKHLFPKPGPDLEVQADPAKDIGRAIAMRTMLCGNLPPSIDRTALESELVRSAGLVAAGIPVTGAMDCRHRRGEYVDEGGRVLPEDPGMRVASIDDLKTTKRINDHVTRGGKILQGWALTADEVVVDTQMVGYGVAEHNEHPETTHVRLAHNYAQTENGLMGVRRMGLVTVEHVVRHWEGRVEPLVREMVDVAAADKAHDVPVNTRACKSYGRECPHMSYCQPDRTLADVFDLTTGGAGAVDTGENMSGNGLFDTLVGANGVAQHASQVEGNGLFGAQPPALPTTPPPVMGDAERQRQIDEAKAKLRRHPLEGVDGYVVGQDCNGKGYYASSNGQGFVPIEPGHVCKACAQAPQIPHVGQVNPLDSPPFDPVVASKPLPLEQVVKIEDPEIRARAEAVAKAAAEREALQKQASGETEKKKTTGNCAAGGTTVPLTQKEIKDRRKKCPNEDCNLVHKIKDKDFTQDFSSMVVPKHRLRFEAPAKSQPQAQPQAPQLSTAPPELPPLPSTPPPLPNPSPGEMTSMVDEMFGKESTLPVLPHEPQVVPTPKPVAKMNSLTVIKHLVQSVGLGLETKETAFDKIAAVLAQ